MRSFRLFLCGVMVLSLPLLSMRASAGNGSGQEWRQRSSSSEEVVPEDIKAEIDFGREVAAKLLARYGLYDNAALTKYVNLVGRTVAMNTNRPELQMHFAVLNTDDINAFAAPGGYIFVTRGALLQMKDESELAGVLAHEVGHVVERHVVKELNIKSTEDSGVTSGLAHIVGGSSESARAAFYQLVDKAMDILLKDGLKREDEAQADRDAVLFCAMAGYDASALSRYLDRIGPLKGKTMAVLDKTHPPFGARVSFLKDTIAAEGINTGSEQTNKQRFEQSVKALL